MQDAPTTPSLRVVPHASMRARFKLECLQKELHKQLDNPSGGLLSNLDSLYQQRNYAGQQEEMARGGEVVQQHGHVGIPEEDVATSLDLGGMATLLPAPEGPYSALKCIVVVCGLIKDLWRQD